ncbi:hypothetical protein swp_0341 [Shewanella piezotolerans WP3]|uniref:Uncharacterized protein n=1 Tax=Shewanella piezotolerans (strain WP3 / JCM 13877) TaxID=225849 RepID=B8CHQ0_SHEPW|nr:hypothetical protein swp_0341 [Shewanella piezotolerans WP3]
MDGVKRASAVSAHALAAGHWNHGCLMVSNWKKYYINRA